MNALKFFSLLALPLSVALSGCTGVNYSEPHQAGMVESLDGEYKRILVTNYGYYLFNTIPLGSGGHTNDSFSLLSDNVSLDAAMKTFKAECEKYNVTEVADLQVERSETSFFSWAPLGTTLGIYWYKEIQISATVATNDSAEAVAVAAETEQK